VLACLVLGVTDSKLSCACTGPAVAEGVEWALGGVFWRLDAL
jgi:hypothetical protein